MIYQIVWGEEVTSSKGTKYYRADLKDPDGKEYQGVAVFTSFKDYSKVMPGSNVEGKITEKDYKGKPSYTLENIITTVPTGGFKGNITKAMETKAQNIEKAQDNKNLGIKISSTMRDAVLIVTTIIAQDPILAKESGTIKTMIKDWRTWLWNEFEKEDKDFPPFN